jgi:hypothetical protein
MPTHEGGAVKIQKENGRIQEERTRNHSSHFGLRVLLEDANPAVPPIDVLVLDLHHLAAPASCVERADDSIAHVVTRG